MKLKKKKNLKTKIKGWLNGHPMIVFSLNNFMGILGRNT